ncbi:MAG: hypothetical protein JNJ41_02460 [Bacteroidia bacterium]|nr:hypothetical protein [Bacteroidia bacterium]
MAERIAITNDFDENELEIGDILWYRNDDLSHPTGDPHPHVIVAIEDDTIHTVCGTSQEQTIERKAQIYGYSLVLFPAINQTSTNGLTSRTFFDCCDTYEMHRNDLQDKFQKGEIVKVSGNVTYSEYEEIRIGLKSSGTVDIINILIHPEDEND